VLKRTRESLELPLTKIGEVVREWAEGSGPEV
jgi:hypothetical protein